MIKQKTKDNQQGMPWLNWLAVKKREIKILYPLVEFKTKFERFSTDITRLIESWIIIKNWLDILSNEETSENAASLIEKDKKIGLMEIYNKRWIALRWSINLYKLLITNSQKYFSEKETHLARIKALDLEWALKIEPILSSTRESLEFLVPIKIALNNPQMIISYIKTHYDELMQKNDKMKYKDTAENLRRIIVVLSNKETEELIRCTNDVKSWPYRGAYGINLYIERALLFLNGGESKYDKEVFLGFRLYFRDNKLVTTLLECPQFRKLMTYKQEIEFFIEARNAIQKSVKTEGKWEGFYAFYNNLDKNIRKVRGIYGNEQFAKILEAFKEKKHEAPIDWENELYILYEDLVKRSYQLVVEPAARALIDIFEIRIKKLEEEKVFALNKLRKLLMEKDPLYRSKREFAILLKKRKRILLKELEKERLEFNAITREVILAMSEYGSKLKQIENYIKATPKELLAEFVILDSYLRFKPFELPDLTAMGKTAMPIFWASRHLKAAENEAKIKLLVEDRARKCLILLNEVININNKISLQIPECMKHIDSRIHNYIRSIVSWLKKAH